jgi:hypothetical protein
MPPTGSITGWRNCGKFACFASLPLHRKISFRTRASETGSVTGWGVTSLVQIISTTQSSQTARFQDDPHSGAFCGDLRPFISWVWSLEVSRRLSGDFWRPVSGLQNSVPGGRALTANAGRPPGIRGNLGDQKRVVLSPVRSYRGFNPSASNCRLHSAGASRNRSTPMPRGKRPSTAARTRSGARNASDIVMLT